ncbi:TPA: hypothetical protein N0F65_007682 [Lagenidium giganteum]|uniref:Protein-serine/threonine phosphatase n=1 Tax=Lagenidium giganteum TaxID=4803 RepID=A0AAV2Z6D8_9STRA|nr:TPA: hypothetical protein N0F65_007682 [Lagenidium giganteum]
MTEHDAEIPAADTTPEKDEMPPTYGVLRKPEDLDRRRSTTLKLEAIAAIHDSRKAMSNGRTSGVHRLLRSDSSLDADTLAAAAADSTEPVEAVAEESEPVPAAVVIPEDISSWSQLKWDHVVLKMTSFSDDDKVTSFRFDESGGTIGRDESNVACIPADKLLADVNHASILYRNGRFYLVNGENDSGTFIRLCPCVTDEDKMQWPLEQQCRFRAGKSDFVVEKFDEITQTLELSAISGKLKGSQFTVTPEGAGIGRSAENAIHAGDGELSRKHAHIWFDELTGRFYLTDLNSTNGTFMKLVGPYQEPYRLEIGDDILISQSCLTVNRFDFGAHANMGARKQMEDSHTIIQDLNISALNQLNLYPQSFFGVFDGHGGMEASCYVSENLHHNIIDEFRLNRASFDPALELTQEAINGEIEKQLISAFEKTDEAFLKDSDHPQAGSTGTTVLVAGNQIYVANVGDSRTVLSRKGEAVRLSNDHKPSRSDEASRIRETGGFVIHGRIMGELAVSRAFGDSPFKMFELPEPPKSVEETKPRSEYDSQEMPVNPNEILKGPLVIPTPEVTVTELTEDEEFVLLASDGLFDVLKDQEAIDFFRRKLAELGDVQRAVEAIVDHAVVQQRSTDNVTAVVIMFKEAKDLEPL